MFARHCGCSDSMAVEGLDLEKIGIEANLVPKEADFFVEQHIQNPPKSTSGKLLFLQFNLKTIITVKPVLSLDWTII